MTNFDQAAHLIMEAARESELPTEVAVNAVEALAKAGLITPDLPTPAKVEDDEHRWGKTHSRLAYDYQTGIEKKIKVPGGVTVIQDENAEAWLDVDHGIHSLTPDDARSLGLALLAAVNYMEEA